PTPSAKDEKSRDTPIILQSSVLIVENKYPLKCQIIGRFYIEQLPVQTFNNAG
ncbi:hypothetical protein SARC_14269, partial [Sphaeroforma arctica JP610]